MPRANWFVRVVKRVGGWFSAGYRLIDPSARRQLAETPLLGLTLIAKRHEPVVARPAAFGRPIVLVHGLGGHRGNFAPLRTWLHLGGRRRTYAMSWPPGEPVEDLAARFSELVHDVARVNALDGDARIDVVAHSMGGIIARLALEDPAVARRVDTLVTLGTPHCGTLAARYAASRHTIALRPGSPLYAKLAHQVPWPASMPRLVCFWSPDDLFMLPSECARIEGAHWIEMQGFTHLTYLLHPGCFQRVREVLSDERRQHLGPPAGDVVDRVAAAAEDQQAPVGVAVGKSPDTGGDPA